MANNNTFLNDAGLSHLWNLIINRITASQTATESKIPKNVSAFENDAKYITVDDIPEGAAASTTVPKADSGSGSVGKETTFARGDHIHPTDSTRLATDGDASKTTVTFTPAETRMAIVSGESFKTIAGKILKYMNDFGALAYKTKVMKTDLAKEVTDSLSKADSALQSFTESDPTVPAWAKNPLKPTYTASEVGALSLDDAEANYAKKSDLTKVYKFQGSVATYTDLLAIQNATVNDVYNVIESDMNYGYTENGTWDPLGGIFEVNSITNERIDEITGGATQETV